LTFKGIFLITCLEVIQIFKGPKKVVSLGLPEECYNQIKELANDTYRSVPSYIRMIVYNYLRRLDKPGTKQDDWWLVK